MINWAVVYYQIYFVYYVQNRTQGTELLKARQLRKGKKERGRMSWITRSADAACLDSLANYVSDSARRKRLSRESTQTDRRLAAPLLRQSPFVISAVGRNTSPL